MVDILRNAYQNLPPQLPSVWRALVMLPTAAGLGAALGLMRANRRSLAPRASHVVHTQILLAMVGAMIMLVVAESLARAFAIVGAAGLVRYRAQVDDPKDAGVMLAALATGLAVGSGMMLFATLACGVVLLLLWLLESFEPPDRAKFDVTISTKDSAHLRPQLEQAFGRKGVSYQLVGSAPDELRYEVTVPFKLRTQKLTKIIKRLDGHNGASVEWNIKKYKTVLT
jgi:uncharacterized membrane protein YhiD involved in acid resistance